jgi:hypothetical protein
MKELITPRADLSAEFYPCTFQMPARNSRSQSHSTSLEVHKQLACGSIHDRA